MHNSLRKSIIHNYYVVFNNGNVIKTSAKKWSMISGSFMMSFEAKVIVEVLEFDILADNSTLFHKRSPKNQV